MLPKSLNPKMLASKAVPPDMTLGEMKKFIMTTEEIKVIKSKSRYPDQVRIRVLGDRAAEASDGMTIGEARRLIAAGKLHIVIDDGEGGALVD